MGRRAAAAGVGGSSRHPWGSGGHFKSESFNPPEVEYFLGDNKILYVLLDLSRQVFAGGFRRVLQSSGAEAYLATDNSAMGRKGTGQKAVWWRMLGPKTYHSGDQETIEGK